MKKYLLFAVISVCFAFSTYALDEVVYEYDDSGNRRFRKIQTVRLRSEVSDDSSEVDIAQESLFDYKIKVYPNPTYGNLSIEIEEIKIESPLDLVLFDQSGTILQRHTITDSIIYLDLSPYPSSAWYIVSFMLNGERRDIKVIKL